MNSLLANCMVFRFHSIHRFGTDATVRRIAFADGPSWSTEPVTTPRVPWQTCAARESRRRHKRKGVIPMSSTGCYTLSFAPDSILIRMSKWKTICFQTIRPSQLRNSHPCHNFWLCYVAYVAFRFVAPSFFCCRAIAGGMRCMRCMRCMWADCGRWRDRERLYAFAATL